VQDLSGGLPSGDAVVYHRPPPLCSVLPQMAIMRLGTCGATQPPAKLGDMLVASKGSIVVR